MEEGASLSHLPHPSVGTHSFWRSFLQDDRFWVPRANFWVSLRSPVLDASPLNAATARLFTDLFRDHVSEETYAAELAGLRMSAMYSGGHIVLSTSGYNDRLPVLMKTAIEKLKGFKIDPERFELLKDDVRLSSQFTWSFSRS